MVRKVTSLQSSLFPMDVREYAERLGLNWWAVKKLHDDGWLSFDPDTTKITHATTEAEFTFLCNLLAAGCDPIMLKKMLKDLEKPYAYRFSDMYFDWQSGNWKSFPKERSLDELFDEFIDQATEDEDRDTLKVMRSRIEGVLEDLEDENDGLDEASFKIIPDEDPVVVAAKALLKKIVGSNLLPDAPEEQDALGALQDAFDHIPNVLTGIRAKMSLNAPELKVGSWKVSKWWSFELVGAGTIRLVGGGWVDSDAGGDSFTSLSWELFPGDTPIYDDYSAQLRHVPGVLSFPEEVKEMNLENGGYELEFEDIDE